MRIAIIGYSGSGKSTLAKKMGEIYGIPILHMDKVYFLSNWVERDKDEAKQMILEFMNQDSWVMDGNYSSFHYERRLELADLIVYMNFNRFACFYRAFRRYRKYKGRTRDSVAEGCNEKLDLEFVRWILYDGRNKKKRKKYANIVQKYNDKTVVIKNQRELNQFLRKLETQN